MRSIYSTESALTATGAATLLALETALGATPSGLVEHPLFFSGFLSRPPVVAAGLLAVADVAATRYFDLAAVRAANLDPVVTASGDRLRFESFSACNGVYARFDLLADGIDSGAMEHGTTNVDINQPLRSALAAVGRPDLVHLGVGDSELRVATLGQTLVERKVDMPDRWVRGFAEVPAAAARMVLAADVSGAAAQAFLSHLPRGAPGPVIAVVQTPRGLAAGVRTARGAVNLAGSARLAATRRVLRFITRLRVFRDPQGTSGWVLELPGSRLTLMLTAEPYRGFSGEGGQLDALAGLDVAADATEVLSQLAWEPAIDPAWLARSCGLSPGRVASALAALATSGTVGFDLCDGAFFHRELPVDDDRVVRDNPRLVAARDLVAAGSVHQEPGRWRVGVPGHENWVTLDPAGCTCLWWARFQGGRGSCKHVLAARITATST